MKKSQIAVLAVVMTLGFINLSYQACGVLKTQGTSTGNPMEVGTNPGSGTPHEPAPSLPPVNQPLVVLSSPIINMLCASIKRCHASTSSDACLTSVLEDSKIPVSLGLPVGSYPNISAVTQAEGSRSLTGSAGAAEQCQAGLQQMDCSQGDMVGAVAGATDFSGASKVLDSIGACRLVFAPSGAN